MNASSDRPAVDTVRATAAGRRRTLFLGTLVLLAATAAWEFGRLPEGGPTNTVSARAYHIPLTPGSEVAQTFTVPWNGFRRVRIQVTIEGSPVGTLHVALDRLDAKGDVAVDRDLRQVQMRLRPLVNDEVVELTFPELLDSAGQRYRLRASVLTLQAGTLSLTANRDDTYPLGSLTIDGRPEPGDLVFAARSSVHTPAGLIRGALAGRPWPFSSPLTFWCLIALFCVSVSGLVVLAAEVTGALSHR